MKNINQLLKMSKLLCVLTIISAFQSFGQLTNVTTSVQPGPVEISFGNYPPNFFSTNPLYCQTFSNCQYDIQITNSTVTDTLFIVYNNNTAQDTIINTGSNPNYLTTGMTFTTATAQLNANGMSDPNGFTLYIHPINKLICGGDTLVVSNFFTNEFYPIPCLYETVDGNLFEDLDLNCSYSGVDNGITNVWINANVQYTLGNRYYNFYTNGASGFFSDNYFKSDDFITADFQLPAIYDFAYSLPPCATPIVTVTSLPATIEFPRSCAADVDVYTWGNSTLVRPLVPFFYYPSMANIGCSPISGVLKLKLDPNVTYNAANSSNPADYVVGDTLFWNYANITNVDAGLGYWNSFFGGVELTPNSSLNIGDFVTLEVITGIPSNDANPANNTYTDVLTVVNSYDPNIKEVVPAGLGAQGYISPTTEKLTYTVHFQNTGNADALNVYILDTLQGNVVHNSLRILSASHSMSPRWVSNDVVRFNFPNINLADSTSNEPASHGFVTFEIDMVTGLNPGTEILNTAHIYFDNNPAIVTNTAKNTIELNNSLASIGKQLELTVAPNPMSNSTVFNLNNGNQTDFEMTLRDLSGKIVVAKQNGKNGTLTLNREQLVPGVYIYSIVAGDASTVGRLIVQ